MVAMHAHFDHICGVPKLREIFPDAGVLGSRETQRVVGKPKILEDFFRQDEMISEVLAEEGILSAKPDQPRDKTIAIDQIIAEGDEIKPDRGGLSIKVLDAPGHSPCSLACYLPREQTMFLSDAAGFQISDSEIFPIFFQGYDLYIHTLKRLMRFPTRILCIPHEQIWTGHRVSEFYQRALESARRAFDTISQMLDAGWDDDTIRQKLFSHYYQGNLKIYTPANINICVGLLLRRVKERGQA
jgi:glyoxylase-like metal-dependent hydrolase (beta-lactamase superfamily II)